MTSRITRQVDSAILNWPAATSAPASASSIGSAIWDPYTGAWMLACGDGSSHCFIAVGAGDPLGWAKLGGGSVALTGSPAPTGLSVASDGAGNTYLATLSSASISGVITVYQYAGGAYGTPTTIPGHVSCQLLCGYGQIWAATDFGVYLSTDNAATFTLKASGSYSIAMGTLGFLAASKSAGGSYLYSRYGATTLTAGTLPVAGTDVATAVAIGSCFIQRTSGASYALTNTNLINWTTATAADIPAGSIGSIGTFAGATVAIFTASGTSGLIYSPDAGCDWFVAPVIMTGGTVPGSLATGPDSIAIVNGSAAVRISALAGLTARPAN